MFAGAISCLADANLTWPPLPSAYFCNRQMVNRRVDESSTLNFWYTVRIALWLSLGVVHFVFIPSVTRSHVNYGYCHRKPTSTHDARRSMLEHKVHWYRLGTTRKAHTHVEFTPVKVVAFKPATYVPPHLFKRADWITWSVISSNVICTVRLFEYKYFWTWSFDRA